MKYRNVLVLVLLLVTKTQNNSASGKMFFSHKSRSWMEWSVIRILATCISLFY